MDNLVTDYFLNVLSLKLNDFFTQNQNFLNFRKYAQQSVFVNDIITNFDKSKLLELLRKDITDETINQIFGHVFIMTIEYEQDAQVIKTLRMCLLNVVLLKIFMKVVFEVDSLNIDRILDKNLSIDENLFNLVRRMSTVRRRNKGEFENLVNKIINDTLYSYDKNAELNIKNMQIYDMLNQYIGDKIEETIALINEKVIESEEDLSLALFDNLNLQFTNELGYDIKQNILILLNQNLFFDLYNSYDNIIMYDCVKSILQMKDIYKSLFIAVKNSVLDFVDNQNAKLDIKKPVKVDKPEFDEPLDIEQLLFMTQESAMENFNNDKRMFVENYRIDLSYNGNQFGINYYKLNNLKYFQLNKFVLLLEKS